MAEAPPDRGGDIRRQVIFRKGNPADEAELARRALEAQSRLAAITGRHYGEDGAGSWSGDEFITTADAGSEPGLAIESLHEKLPSLWGRYFDDKAFTSEDDEEIKKAQNADDFYQSHDSRSAELTKYGQSDPRRAALRKRAMSIAERRLKKARSGDTEEVFVSKIPDIVGNTSSWTKKRKDADSRRAILQDQTNMDVTDEDVQGLLSDLGK